MREMFPEHENQIYDWNSNIWSAPLTDDDVRAIVCAVIFQTIKDAKNNDTWLRMNLTQEQAHIWYLEHEDGLKTDCEIMGIDYKKTKEKIINE